MRKSVLFTVASLFIITSCTSYQPSGFTGGYRDTQLGESIFQISFRGNGYTSKQRVDDFALLRAAEKCMEVGYPFFIVRQSSADVRQGSFTTPTQSRTTGTANVYGNQVYGSARTTTTGGDTITYSKHSATLIIECFRERPDTDELVYEAEWVYKSIRETYDIE